MKPSSDVTGLYRSFPAYLWVEDEETRTYLETAWTGESRIKMYVAGGYKGRIELVRAIAEAQRDQNRIPTEISDLRAAILFRIGH